MGLRFRKSVTICKGVRVNFSKSGVSCSLGVKGASLNLGKSGARVTVGLPGSGLSYSKSFKLWGKGKSSKSRKDKQNEPTEVNLRMHDNGKVTYHDENGKEITNAALLKEIKADPDIREELARLENEKQQEVSATLEDQQRDAEEFLNIHWLAPCVSPYEEFVDTLNSLEPETYTPRQFSQPKPTEAQVLEELTAEAEEATASKLFKKKAQREYIEDRLSDRLAQKQQQWDADRQEFEAQEAQKEKKQNAALKREFEAAKRNLRAQIGGEEEAINDFIDAWIRECSLPVEINVNYDYSEADHRLFVDLDLPEIEDLPDTELIQGANGKLKEKKKTQQKLRQEYATLIFGLSIFVAANLMDITPAIHTVVLSAYTQRRDAEGTMNNDYILSVKFTRDIFEQTVFTEIDPMDFCMQFDNRCKTTSTLIFKPIEPFSE